MFTAFCELEMRGHDIWGGGGWVEFIGEVEILKFLDAYRIMGVPTHYTP